MIVLPKCEFPGCTRRYHHGHHIVYYPEEVVKPLCREHHAEITMLNGIHGRRVRHQLSNSYRWWLWYQWIAGKLKPRRTRRALEYIEEWDHKPDPPPPVAPRVPESVDEAPEKRKKSAKRKRAASVTKPRHRTAVTEKRRSGK